MKKIIILIFILNINILNCFWEKCTEYIPNVIQFTASIVKLDNLVLTSTNATENSVLFVSNDNGMSWSKLNSLWDELELNHIFYASLYYNNEQLYIYSSLGLYSSSDKGETWEHIAFGMQDADSKNVRNILVHENYYFALTGSSNDNQSEYQFSSDNGISWETKNIEQLQNNNSIYRFNILENKIFALTLRDIYVSENFGETWNRLESLYLPNYNYFEGKGALPISIHKINDNIIFFTSHTVYLSTDNGSKWKRVLYDENAVLRLNTIFAMDSYVFIGGAKCLYRSNDSGITWELINTDLSTIIALAANDEYLFASNYNPSTQEHGLYRVKLSEITSVNDTQTQQALSISPLPSSEFITISGIEHGENVEIYSLLGIKLFETLYTGKIDISRLSMGVYYVKVAEQVEKFVVGERGSGLGGR